jgi:MinD-like ATPase involved in chromosome partitioning or flagellar assembly
VSKIVSVHSFRGGTGKSNVTANVAVAVARRGHRVGIVDTDIQSPGIHVLFGFDEEKAERTLNDYLWGRAPIEAAAYEVSKQLKTASGEPAVKDGAIFLVPSSIKAGEIAKVLREGYDVGLLNDGFHDLIERLNLDYLFIDTHPGLNEETLLSITMSDLLLIVVRPDRQDFQGTAVTVEVARKLDVPALYLVLNKVLTSYDFKAMREDVEKLYDATVAAILPTTDALMRLGSADIFSLRNPDDAWSKEMLKIADRVVG